MRTTLQYWDKTQNLRPLSRDLGRGTDTYAEISKRQESKPGRAGVLGQREKEQVHLRK